MKPENQPTPPKTIAQVFAELPPARKKKVVDRFWNFVPIRKVGECWNWHGGKTEKGYGQFPIFHEKSLCFRAHRVAVFLLTGCEPSRLGCHRCDNPACVNPAHIFDGDARANAADAINKGRFKAAKGCGSFASKLTTSEVAQIKRLLPSFNNKQLGQRFGVTPTTICMIRRGRIWKEAK